VAPGKTHAVAFGWPAYPCLSAVQDIVSTYLQSHGTSRCFSRAECLLSRAAPSSTESPIRLRVARPRPVISEIRLQSSSTQRLACLVASTAELRPGNGPAALLQKLLGFVAQSRPPSPRVRHLLLRAPDSPCLLPGEKRWGKNLLLHSRCEPCTMQEDERVVRRSHLLSHGADGKAQVVAFIGHFLSWPLQGGCARRRMASMLCA
jgi:hypothetical protein